MKNIIQNDRGNSLVELIMVMMLLVLFGVTIYTIIYSGSDTQRKIIENKEAQADARIALSYVNVKIRQHDSEGTIQIQPYPGTGENAIVLKSVDFIEEDSLDTWIFYDDNAIYEFNGLSDEIPDRSLSLPVIEADGLLYQVEYDEEHNAIKNSITYHYGEDVKTISSYIRLRTLAGNSLNES